MADGGQGHGGQYRIDPMEGGGRRREGEVAMGDSRKSIGGSWPELYYY